MYNEIVTRLFQSPYHQGRPPQFDAVGQAGTPGEGPSLTVYLQQADGRIATAYFETYGCPASVACGSFVCGWAEGRAPEEAQGLEAEPLRKALGGLPLGKEHAADLAVTALRRGAEELAAADRAEGFEKEPRG